MNDAHPHADGTQADQFWERHYHRQDRMWSGRPNPVLVEVAGSLPTGSALDLGCGEGGDAIWLAGLGWQVTAVDISATALDRAAADAAAAGVAGRIDFQRHDLAQTFPAGTFDLVSAQYLQSPVAFPRDRVLRRAAAAVAPAGRLLIVDHASVRPWASDSHPHPHHRFPTPAETLATLDLSPAQWRTEVLSGPERQATGPNGETATVTDSVVVARRSAS